ncbi:MAG TPA: hypothetical protein VNH38_05490 [Candidatus Dormibacteraeota bacterium]|nr:hypothetical protein [Candidatus Dormibacteraeota bacterium]
MRLLLSVEWICHTLWLAQRREPELVQLQEERGSTGFPHYILSRAGNLPDVDWASALYVMPPSLVDHLRPRCLVLEPGSYFVAAMEAGATALRRLRPNANGGALGELARASRPDGQLPLAWWELPPGQDPHRELLWAAMTLREGRAFAHYQAATAQGLQPLELLLLTAVWQGHDGVAAQRFFRWGDDEAAAARASLRAGGWLNEQGGLSAAGRARREALESRTDDHSERLLDSLSDRQLAQLVSELPLPD